MELLILLLIMIFWIISALLKAPERTPDTGDAEHPYPQDIFYEPPEEEYENTQKEIKPPPVKIVPEKKPEKSQPRKKEKRAVRSVTEMLKSEDSLKKAILVSEILGRPAAER